MHPSKRKALSVSVIVFGFLCFNCKGEAPAEVPIAAVNPATPEAEMPPVPEPKVEPVVPVEKTPECTLQTPLKPGIPGSPGNLIASARNPNGDSELSDLMRKMVDDLQEVRQQIMNGALPSTFPSGHERIRCTWPTDLDARNEIFDAMAQQYLKAYETLAKSNSGTTKDEIETRYAAVVGSCVTCHENSCRGPIPMIKNLHLAPPDAP